MSRDGADLRETWRRFYRSNAEADIRGLLEAYPQERSLHVDVLELYEFDESFTRALFSHPDRILQAGAEALRGLDDAFNRVNVRLTNHPGLLGLESLRSRHVSELVTVEGVTAAVDQIQVIAAPAVFGCQRCGHRVERDSGRRSAAPGQCPECGASGSYRLDHGRSTFVDVQRVDLEGSSDDRHGGDGAASIEAVLDDDLVGSVTVGDRLLATGVVRLASRADSDRFDFYLDVNSIDEEPGRPPSTTDDVSTELREAITSRWELLTEP